MGTTESEGESAEKRPRVRVASLAIGFFAILAGLIMSRIVPEFQKVFDDLGRSLPELTSYVVHGPKMRWPVLGVAFAALVCLKDLRVRGNMADYLNATAVAIFFGVGFLVVISLFLPLVVTIRGPG